AEIITCGIAGLRGILAADSAFGCEDCTLTQFRHFLQQLSVKRFTRTLAINVCMIKMRVACFIGSEQRHPSPIERIRFPITTDAHASINQTGRLKRTGAEDDGLHKAILDQSPEQRKPGTPDPANAHLRRMHCEL